VAKSKKTGGRDWKPGERGNPAGRPPVPADVKEARRLNQVELERVMNKYLYMSMRRLERKKEDSRTRGIDRIVIGIILKGTKGNVPCLNILAERLVGKVKTEIEVTRPNQKPIEETLGDMSDEELEAYYRKLEEKARSGSR